MHLLNVENLWCMNLWRLFQCWQVELQTLGSLCCNAFQSGCIASNSWELAKSELQTKGWEWKLNPRFVQTDLSPSLLMERSGRILTQRPFPEKEDCEEASWVLCLAVQRSLHSLLFCKLALLLICLLLNSLFLILAILLTSFLHPLLLDSSLNLIHSSFPAHQSLM